MTARQIAHNSGRILAFAFASILLFASVYFGVAFGDTLIIFVWSVDVPIVVPVIITLLIYVPIMVQTLRRYPAVSMLPDATGELRGWLYTIGAVDLVLGIVNYCPGVLPN